ncbi:peptidoglycan D,D-transpeptidase FtsI family protein [Candidatus Pelagibacter sp. HIMB1517]|uniref:peptidoglycan D,D-transpeptidase FtsI family protein n=1 Tax=Candidatus Pelagibacter sp. HIMB1517 TaxID=3413341 RepID=UPI003F83DB00
MKKNNQLNLYFDESIYQKKENKNLDIRINVIISFFLLLSFLTLSKLIFLGFDKKELSLKDNYIKQELKRRSIVDQNNNLLAYSIKTHDLLIRTKKIKNFNNLNLKLRIKFPEVDLKKIKNFNKKSFHVIKKNLSPVEYNNALSLGEPSLELVENETRIYPDKNLFSHILGNVDTDQQGISGIELFLNDEILDKKKINIPIVLSVDQRVQFIIRETLLDSINIFSAKGASAVLMDAGSGKILSMVSLPDYNLNDRSELKNKDNLFNKNSKGLYELGSVFKTFVIANALEQKKITRDKVYKNLPSQVACGKFFIKEYKYSKDKKNLSVNDILVESSNIGTIRIIQDSGLETYQNFLEKLEIFDYSGIELPEVSASTKKRWGKCRTLTAGYGHGINTTPLQLTRAYASIINGGNLLEPTLLKNKKTKIKNKIISEENSKIIKKILRTNVDNNYIRGGSGRKADIHGYNVMGKTGTAEKPSNIGKGYSNEILNVFVSAFDVDENLYVLTVIMDEPKGAPKLWGHNRRESGWNAGYINGQIIKKIGPILNTLKINDYAKLN